MRPMRRGWNSAQYSRTWGTVSRSGSRLMNTGCTLSPHPFSAPRGAAAQAQSWTGRTGSQLLLMGRGATGYSWRPPLPGKTDSCQQHPWR